MLIILEGADGVGKTTLARELAERIGGDVTVGHCGPPERHPLEETVLPLDDYRPGAGRHVVMDRFHLGELIYGPIYRGESKLGGLDGPGHRWIDAWACSVGGLLVHVDADLDTVLGRIDVRGDDYVKAEHLGQILDAYRDAFDLSRGIPRRRVRSPGEQTTADGETLSSADYVLRCARELEERTLAGALTGAKFVGAVNPDYLLVGDEPSPRHARGERPTYRAPFVPFRDGCGWFLYGALPTHALIRTAVINRIDLTEEIADRIWASARVVAMGREAERHLRDLKLRHGVVPHPQLVRRFHHARRDEYGLDLIEAANTGRDLTDRYRKKAHA